MIGLQCEVGGYLSSARRTLNHTTTYNGSGVPGGISPFTSKFKNAI